MAYDPALYAFANAQTALVSTSYNTVRNCHLAARDAWRVAFLPTPKAQGTRFHHYAVVARTHGRRAASAMPSDSGVNWVLFVGVSMSDVRLWCEVNHWVAQDVTASHDCSGQHFACNVSFRQVGSRIVATQWWGTDV